MTRNAVCTSAQVLQSANFDNVDEVGGADVITEAIEEAEAEVSGDYGNPNKKSTFILDSNQLRYEFRVDDKKTYRVDRVIIRDDNNDRIVYTAGTASEVNHEYTEDLEFNTVTFHADTLSTYNGHRVEIDYVPIHIHHLTRLKAALSLVDNSISVNGEEQVPSIAVRLMSRIKRIEESVKPAEVIGSTNEANFDPTHGETIPQRRFWLYS